MRGQSNIRADSELKPRLRPKSFYRPYLNITNIALIPDSKPRHRKGCWKRRRAGKQMSVGGKTPRSRRREDDAQAPEVTNISLGLAEQRDGPVSKVLYTLELLELILLQLPPQAILRFQEVNKYFQSVISQSSRIQANLFFPIKGANTKSGLKINPLLNCVFPESLPTRTDKYPTPDIQSIAPQFLSLQQYGTPELEFYYDTAKGRDAIEESRVYRKASWRCMSLGTPGMPLTIRFLYVREPNPGVYEIYQNRPETSELGFTLSHVHGIIHAKQYRYVVWEFLSINSSWPKVDIPELQRLLEGVEESLNDNLRIWLVQ
ncbi:hypothetical protein K432DRAFT_386712 [Lepidopterella palustris CBS 459.81]|uniref:F-box domain-containing protein n=1 Tax=Lepidopterella palustris CBS 459.81 TaxID=1314670 RepID=A0A8E2DZQ2_9PEZI|nr:hypothetical protein K432DRAFT_386712 [Lepidopterella palustris CBS 459.81]